MSEKEKKAKDNRSCNWSCIIYPESVNEDWQEKIGEALVDCFVSPLHVSESEKEEEQRKPHRHVLFMFPTKKAPEQVKVLLDEIFGCYAFNDKRCKVASARNYARYLLHLDQPSKQQWEDASQILQWGTKSYSEVINTANDRYETIKRILAFIRENKVYEYSDVMDWALENDEDAFRALCDNCSYVVEAYCKSLRCRIW